MRTGIEVATIIEQIIGEIGKCRREIEEKGAIRAKTIANYDLRLGTAIETLKEEGKFPATLIEKIAKKLCHQDRQDMERAITDYTATTASLQALQAQLNGYQSVYRHLDSM